MDFVLYILRQQSLCRASLWTVKTLAGYRRILSTLECDPDGRSILPLHGLHLLEALICKDARLVRDRLLRHIDTV